jgi:hypothetical protein
MSLFSNLLGRNRNTTSRRRRVRPLVESLEDRVQPAVITYTPSIFTDGVAGSGSLRDQIIKANQDTNTGKDIIELQATTYFLTMQNQLAQDNHALTGDLDIANPHHELVIEGVAKGNTILTKIDARLLNDRVFQITTPGSHVTFRNVIIFGGTAVDDGSQSVNPGTTDAVGGGILSFGSDVTLDNVQLLSNKALAGPVQLVNGQWAPARANAAAPGQDGADGLQAQGGGIAMFGGKLLLLDGSLVANNQALGGDGQMGGGFFVNTDQGSVAGAGGAGGAAQGGGIFARLATVWIDDGSGVQTNQAIAGRGGDGAAGTTGTEPTDLGVEFAAGGHGGDGGTAVGGGLYSQGGSILVSSSSVWTNHATGGDAGAGGNGQVGGDGGQGGAALGGGVLAPEADVDLDWASLSQNRAQGGAGGSGGLATHFVVAPDLWTGPNGAGGAGGAGGAANGGALFWSCTALGKQIHLDNCEMHDNHVTGGQGGQAGAGAFVSQSDVFAITPGGAGGKGGDASGGCLFLRGSGSSQVYVSATTVFQNYARGGDGGTAGQGGYASQGQAGRGGDGGDGGNAQGAGVFAEALFLHVYMQSFLSQGEAQGGWGGDGGDSGITGGNWPEYHCGHAGNGGNGGAGQGSGLFLRNAELSLALSLVLDNSALGGTGGSGGNGDQGLGGGGGAAQGGAICISGGFCGLSQSTLDSNLAYGGNGGYGGHGIFSGSAADGGGSGGGGGTAQGGGLFSTAALVAVNSSTLSDNAAVAGDGGSGGYGSDLGDSWGAAGGWGGPGGNSQGGGAFVDSDVTFLDSTISTNWVRGSLGGVGAWGGHGKDDQSGGNAGGGGNGGLAEGGGICHYGAGTLQLLSSTIAFNTVDSSLGGPPGLPGPGGLPAGNGAGHDGRGGGIFNAAGLVVAKNTLIADNQAHTATDVFGNFDLTQATHDLVGVADSNCNLTVQNSNGCLVGTTTNTVNPMLGPLTSNGGPTWTHQLLKNSPAINAGDNAAVTVSVDQRGLTRIVGGTVDIGAYEVQANETNSSLPPGGSSGPGSGRHVSPRSSANNAGQALGGVNLGGSATLTAAVHALASWDAVPGNLAWTAGVAHSPAHRSTGPRGTTRRMHRWAAFESALWQYTPDLT